MSTCNEQAHVHTHTHKTTTVTLAAHARRGLIIATSSRGSCKVDGTAHYIRGRLREAAHLCNVWGVARDLRKSSIVTSLQADSRAPDDGRN